MHFLKYYFKDEEVESEEEVVNEKDLNNVNDKTSPSGSEEKFLTEGKAFRPFIS